MKKCITCNLIYDDSNRFCSRCGGGLVAVENVPVQPAPVPAGGAEPVRPSGAAGLIGQAINLQSQGYAKQAAQVLQRGLEMYPDDIEIRQRLIISLVQTQDWPGAITQLSWLTACLPDNMPARLLLAECLIAAGNLDDAERQLQCAVTIPCGDEQLLRLRDLLVRQKMYPQALAVVGNILSIWPADIATLKTMARCAAQIGDRDSELDAYRRILKVIPGDVRASFGLGVACAADAGPTESCEQLLRFALAGTGGELDDSERALCSASLAAVLAGRGDLPGAVDLLKSSCLKGPVDSHLSQALSGALTRVGTNLLSAGDLDNALTALEAAENAATSPESRSMLAEARIRLAARSRSSGMTGAAFEHAVAACRLENNQEYRRMAADLGMEFADQLESRSQYGQAFDVLRMADEFADSSDPVITRRFQAAAARKRRGRNRRLILVAGGAAMVVAVVVAILLARGNVDVTVNSATRVVIFDGDTQIAAVDGNSLKVDRLLTGRYKLKAESSLGCYEHLDTSIFAPFGRGTREIKLSLKPITGAVSVGTSPAGAVLSVKNAVEEKTCKTPCRLDHVLAIESDITVTYGDITPFTKRAAVPARGTLALGFITFDGEIEVVTEPEGATVTLDGKKTLTTPGRFSELFPLIHQLKIEKPGYRTQFVQETTAEGNLNRLKVELTPRWGTLIVGGRMPDGSICSGPVEIDGQVAGRTGTQLKVLAKDLVVSVQCDKGRGSLPQVAVRENNSRFAAVIVSPLEWAVQNGFIQVTGRTAWQVGAVGPCQDWFSADMFCQDLVYGYYADWRLPTRKELVELDEASFQASVTAPDQYYWAEHADDYEAVVYKAGSHGAGRLEKMEKGGTQLCNIVCARTLFPDETVPGTPAVQ